MRVFVLLLSLICASPALAQWKNPFGGPGAAGDFRKKAEAKKQSRWTLAEWLEQKERNRMMDLWLGMYAPSPYEFILSGQYEPYEVNVWNGLTETRTKHTSGSGSVAFYALILGVEAGYENNVQEGYTNVEGLVNLRVLGNSNQSTHLNLSYGARRKSFGGMELNQQLAGAELDLFLAQHLGVHGLYRVYFPVEDANLGTTKGSKSEVGAFIDYSFFRLFGNWFVENQTSTLNTIESRRDRSGFQYGLKIYF
ncbi:MAG: hypothetical protein KF767_14330 [Bdellovibrionaceae bacterium]|nr:hypothetical protein [Pseudobdellovibrionaceae bacterium]